MNQTPTALIIAKLLLYMHNIRLVIQYDGTAYHGWQVQPGVITVEEVITDKLGRITGEKIKLSASARTDSGVHARCQVLNFRTDSAIPPGKLKLALNRLLPADIVAASASFAPYGFNARYNAKFRLYRYTILNRRLRSPFDLRYCYFFPYTIDTGIMRHAAKFLTGKHDFSSFQASFGKRKNCIRTVEEIKLFQRAGFIHMDICADGFLTHMVRIVMGTLLEAGRGKIPAEEIKKILNSKDRQKAGPTLPSRGLCLMKVVY